MSKPAATKVILTTAFLAWAFSAFAPHAAAQERYARAQDWRAWREYGPALALLDSIGTDSLAQPLKCWVLLQQKDYRRLLSEATQVAILWPGTAGARAAVWQLAFAQEQLGQYDEAMASYRAAAEADSTLRGYASFRIARCQAKLSSQSLKVRRRDKQRKDGAEDRFRPALVRSAPPSTPADIAAVPVPAPAGKKPYALKLSARYVKRKQYDRARKLLAEFIRAYPRSSWRGEAAYQIAKCWERQGKIDQALAAYRGLADTAPATAWADDALFRAGWCQYRLNDSTMALQTWRDLEQTFPASDCRAAAWYWSAKLLATRGENAATDECLSKLVRAYPYSFYGLKAARQFADSAIIDSSSTALVRTALPHPDSSAIARDPVYQLGARLAEYGLCADAVAALSRLDGGYRCDAASLYRLAAAYAQCGQDERAIDTALRALRLHDGVRPSELLDIIYPRRYLATVRRVSDSARLDPAMVLAVIHKESKFDERCRSWAGARGLMQVMPKTGRLLAGSRKFPQDKLYDPLLSITFGTKFLGAMLREFNGSWMQALAAYNAGPARVHAWLQDRNCRQDEDYFLEQIFVPETKRYVQVVMENYYMYRLLLREEAGS